MADGARPKDDFSQRHYAAIGRVAAVWAKFEATLDLRAIELADFEIDRGRCFALQIMGPRNKLNAYMAIAELRGADRKIIREVNKLTEKARCLGEKRNRIVHDQWKIKPGGSPIRFELTAKKKLVAEEKHHATAVVDALHDKIENLISSFELLHNQLLGALGT